MGDAFSVPFILSWFKVNIITLGRRRPKLLPRAGTNADLRPLLPVLMIYRVKRPNYSSEIPLESLLVRSVQSVKQLIRVP